MWLEYQNIQPMINTIYQTIFYFEVMLLSSKLYTQFYQTYKISYSILHHNLLLEQVKMANKESFEQ